MESFPDYTPSWTSRSIEDWLTNAIVIASGPCWQCGDETVFADLSFESYLCSEACVNEAWSAYVWACYWFCRSDYGEHPEYRGWDEHGHLHERNEP